MTTKEQLTPRQREALVTLRRFGVLSRFALAAKLGTSGEGASQTAASLVRRQMVFNFREGNVMHYAITNYGMAQVNTTDVER